VFYPTRGILCWYSRATGLLQPLPGADDPRFVQMGAVWSPDGRYLVFARAHAVDPESPGAPPARFANDPNELPMQYDLYRIPFRDGSGGAPEPVAGASRNDMSNSFPKISPDGRWIVFVKARNGLLMRPDSQLYIVPVTGGQARRMRANTSLMNSWHSFSPNGRWLVFSSKSRSPYTQMYLTHLDEDGNDSPPIRIENSTAGNRAVNIPEFVNIAPDGLEQIAGPVLEYYKLVNSAMYLKRTGRLGESITVWKRILELRPDDPLAHANLGTALLMEGRGVEAAPHVQKAAELRLTAAVAANPRDAAALRSLGRMLLEKGRLDEAAEKLRQAIEVEPTSAAAHCDFGILLLRTGKPDESAAEFRKALDLDSRYAPGYFNLALVLEERGERDEAVRQWRKALEINPQYEEAHDRLGNALYARGDIRGALAEWRQGTNDLPVLLRAAWIRATYPDFSIRDGREAIALAVRAVELSRGQDAAVWDVLAAAYAEAGRFADAVLTEKRALALTEQDHRPELAAAIRDRMALFEAEIPFRDKTPANLPGGAAETQGRRGDKP